MKKLMIIPVALLLLASLASAQVAKSGAADFVKYLEENKETLGFEKFTQEQEGGRILFEIYGTLATQQALLDVFDRFAILGLSAAMEGMDRVVISVIFQGESPATAVPVAPQVETTQAGSAAKPAHRAFRFKVGAAGLYDYILDKNIDGLYGRLLGAGIDLSYRFVPKADFWLSASYASRSAHPDWIDEELQLTLIPFTAAFRYHVMEKGRWDLFLGAGADFYLIRENNPVEDIKTTAFGFCALGGSYAKLSERLYAQAVLKYNMISKDVYPELDMDHPLDLSGFELRLGVAFAF